MSCQFVGCGFSVYHFVGIISQDAVEDSSGMRQGSKAAQATSLPTGAAPSDDPPGKEFDADPELAQRIATVASLEAPF